jgi:acyl-[acyl-carrier-protein]-phospholipid O-acyltransferase/long-chain-fatty-acid--[acyl-carrier-protein] ligase
MATGSLGLLRSRRFLPLFATQFLNALNDNLFKSALVVLVTYRLAAGPSGQVLSLAAAGLFILPFFLLSATAGRLADKYEKRRLIVIVKALEIPVLAVGAVALAAENVPLLLGMLFLLGAQSTFFAPLKFGILPDQLRADELLAGNALIEAGTFLAILAGTLAGSALILAANGTALVGAALVACAALGCATSLIIPRTRAAAPDLALSFNIVAETRDVIGYAAAHRGLFRSILGISWFWLVGATFLALFPAYVRDALRADEGVVTLFLATFSIGIGAGSLLCNAMLRGEVTPKYVPIGALGLAVFTLDLWAAGTAAPGAADLAAFLARPANWRLVADLFLIAVSGGFFIVPLYAILQAWSEPSHRARVIAANNVLNALFMVAGAAVTASLSAAGLNARGVFLVLGAAGLGVTIYIVRIIPDEVLKLLAAAILKALYRVEVRGLESLKELGDKAVIVVNHVSFLDAALIGAFLPGRPLFAINTRMAEAWWVRPFLRLVDAFPLDPANPLALKQIVRAVAQGRRCVIFPEGRLTVTGSLMKIYEGPGLIADRVKAPIVPVRIDGVQHLPFTRLKGKIRTHLFPKITISVLPPRPLRIPAALVGRARRRAVGRALHDIMIDLMFASADTGKTLFGALLDARRAHGAGTPIVEDTERRPLTYARLVAASLALGRRCRRLAAPGETIGVLLPTANAGAVTFFALQSIGAVPALLNFTSGAAGMAAACRAAKVRTILTSRRFVAAAKLEPVLAALPEGVATAYLEDLRATLGWRARLAGLLGRYIPRAFHRRAAAADSAAVVLFTSGSEGQPKGVALSHRNLLANRAQIAAVIDFNPTDVVFNALPMFHAFGMTGGVLLPVLAGVRTVLYPSPLHYRIIPELIYDRNATIVFGTDTFLAGYGKAANPYDFYSVRYIFAGAERVKPETRALFAEKFGLRILEGYGATETSPVLALNTAMHYKAGTVGRLLPGLDVRLEPVPGLDEGKRLLVRGPNVMLGYLKADRPGELQPPEDGWYDTGDLVSVDDEGFVTILGRAKRFAKIAGEMVSLSAVEELASAAWPDHAHAVVTVPDPKRGESLVLVTTRAGASREALVQAARSRGLPELWVPKAIRGVDKLPLLGTGKTDYRAVSELVQTMAEAASA